MYKLYAQTVLWPTMVWYTVTGTFPRAHRISFLIEARHQTSIANTVDVRHFLTVVLGGVSISSQLDCLSKEVTNAA